MNVDRVRHALIVCAAIPAIVAKVQSAFCNPISQFVSVRKELLAIQEFNVRILFAVAVFLARTLYLFLILAGVPVGCQRNSECKDSEVCIERTCVNSCLIKDPCGPNAECFAERHDSKCRCLKNFEGNPYDGCTPIGCRSDSECDSNEKCYRNVGNGECLNPCLREDICAPIGSECIAANHKSNCRCIIGYTGNGYDKCTPLPTPECVYDGDCPVSRVCLREKCEVACNAFNPCKSPAKCNLIETTPVKTLVCSCPDGYITNGQGACVTLPPLVSGCENDDECSESDACINALCKDPCACGLNANCQVINHRPICTCNPNFYGNPEIECVELGCQSDSECEEAYACRREECRPVCGPDHWPCGGEAICKGISHQATCHCPQGLIGDPYVTCNAVECSDNSICPLDKACVNHHCVDPCARNNPCTSPEFECFVINHEAKCKCPVGYIGDRTGSCKQGKCRISQLLLEY